jgi:uncharacterized protein (TIGR02679 family)
MATFDDPGLDRLWDALAQRLQRNGLAAKGSVTLSGLTRGERFALAGLIGRPVNGERARLDLAMLDARIRATGGAPGLVAATTARRGPLVDLPARRADVAARRRAVWTSAREELAQCGMAAEPWVEAWIESVRPVVARVPAARASEAMTTAVRCLSRLSWSGVRRGRTELATSVAGDSHALDDGTLISTLVLRAIAARVGSTSPVSAADRRRLWHQAGVLGDEVSTTVLTLGLTPQGASPVAKALRLRSDAGCESHLTLRDLLRLDSCVPAGTPVWICENPRVLEAVMDAYADGARVVMVCVAGNPTFVVTSLLARMVESGAALHYRGDFDWPGVAIANRVVSEFGAVPWRMGHADYEAALAAAGKGFADLPALEGRKVEAAWDAELTLSMERAGKAVHEEGMLDLLVADMTEGGWSAEDRNGEAAISVPEA